MHDVCDDPLPCRPISFGTPAAASTFTQRVGRQAGVGPTVALAAALSCVPGLAAAQPIDLSHGGPIGVTALGGIDWDQTNQTVTAHEDARATRGNATVTADVLVAHYRKKAGAAAPPTPKPATPSAADPPAATPPATGPVPPGASPAAEGDTGNNEIYRLNAEGRVHIFTPTDQAWGDHAVYDIDQAVLVLTGRGLRLTTPQDVLTARDAMEYWSAKHMAVARGDASATSSDGRRIRGDTLVGYTAPDQPAVPGKPKPAAPDPSKAGDPLAGGKLQRVEAYGHVQVRTLTDIVTGDRGVYLPDTGLARVLGNVHITRGENQLNGAAAIVNMKTGLATLTQAPGGKVQGLIVPNGSGGSAPGGTDPAPKGKSKS